MCFQAIPPATPLVKAASWSLRSPPEARSPALPGRSTLDELGIKGQEAETMQGVLVPAGTPKPIVDLLTEIARIVNLPDVRDKMLAIGLEPDGMSPAEFAAYIKADVAKWKKVIADAKIRRHRRMSAALQDAMQVGVRRRTPWRDRLGSNRDFAPGLIRSRDRSGELLQRTLATFPDHALNVEARRGGRTNSSCGHRRYSTFCCVRPRIGAHARAERQSVSAGRDGSRDAQPITASSTQENADAGRPIISWIPSRLSLSETWLR